MESTLLTYVWLDKQDNFNSTSLVLRNLKITNIKEINPRAIDFIINDNGKHGTQSAVLHPVKLYKNCFKPNKNSFLVLCNAQFSNEDFDRNVFEKEVVFGVKQQFYLTDNDFKPINDNNVTSEDYDLPLYNIIYKSHPKNKILLNYTAHLEKLLIGAEIKLLEVNSTILSQIIISICESGSYLGDDIIMLRYIASELANTMDLKAVFNNNLDKKQDTKCVFDYYTPEMMVKNTGYDALLELVKKIEENHENFNKNCLVEGQSPNKFKLSIGHFKGSIRIPIQTYSNKSGSINDMRSLSNCNPYKVINNIVNCMGIKSKKYYDDGEANNILNKVISDEDELNIFMKPYLTEISFKIKKCLSSIINNLDNKNSEIFKTKVDEIRKKYDKNIIDLLRNKKTGEMYDLVEKLLADLKEAEPSTEINLNE